MVEVKSVHVARILRDALNAYIGDETPEGEVDMMFLSNTHRIILARLQDMYGECAAAGDTANCAVLKQVLESPRRNRRMMLAAVLDKIEAEAVTVELFGNESFGGPLQDLLTWLLENSDKIIAFIKMIISLFSPA